MPFSQTVGEGSATVLRNGRSYAAQWDRPAASDGSPHPRRLPVSLRTWIVLTPN